MIVLVINSGSSSLKYQLLDMSDETVLARGICERIGIVNHKTAMQEVLTALTDAKTGVISSVSEIDAVGHRIVHGGESFQESVIIDEYVIEKVKKCIELAPLHNPSNIAGVEVCREIMPDTPMVGVFDTAFHQTMPDYAYIYALPYAYYNQYKIRRYGFHGTSHLYVAQKAALFVQRPLEELKIITCHLGNGASVCAVQGGKSIDTSFGFTPLEGLAMGTRSGDIDPAIIRYLMEKENLTIDKIDFILNHESGLLGVSGISSDIRDIEAAAEQGHERSRLAIDLFCYRVRKYIGEYAAAMGGLDVLAFSAGIGENSETIRKKSATGLEFLGIAIDDAKNKAQQGKETDIGKTGAGVRTLVIPTNEELMIARETVNLLAHTQDNRHFDKPAGTYVAEPAGIIPPERPPLSAQEKGNNLWGIS